jgi:hypothetical protein
MLPHGKNPLLEKKIDIFLRDLFDFFSVKRQRQGSRFRQKEERFSDQKAGTFLGVYRFAKQH